MSDPPLSYPFSLYFTSTAGSESMESLNSSTSMGHNLRSEVQAARSNTLQQVRSSAGIGMTSPSQSPRLNRSNSIRYVE